MSECPIIFLTCDFYTLSPDIMSGLFHFWPEDFPLDHTPSPIPSAVASGVSSGVAIIGSLNATDISLIIGSIGCVCGIITTFITVYRTIQETKARRKMGGDQP